ncbi:MAG: class 1 fructose-bisphosphatase [Acidobacteria bacterium]|nr:class 1 fructose-bisphosphatase [Acidobacteriota bacterium]
MGRPETTLSRFILEEEERAPRREPEFPALMAEAALAAKAISREIRRAALTGKLGFSGEANPSGEAQKKLDLAANEIVLDAFGKTGLVAAVISEEMEKDHSPERGGEARYLLCIDPLDGSSNTDVNGPVGTIFGFYRRKKAGPCANALGEIRAGADLVAAGYVMYGPSTILVYSRGLGVNGFTLDHGFGGFLLTHPDLRCPRQGKYYSANLGNYPRWEASVRRFVDHLTGTAAGAKGSYSLRYVGALVADVHRNLLEGGIFFYPGDDRNRNGKLRLLYECAPLAFLIQQAGGLATTGRERILDVRPESPHQKVPLAIGSPHEVELYEKFVRTGGA